MRFTPDNDSMENIEFYTLIETLQTNGENERIEAKQATYSVGKSILPTISAFSNEPDMGGGYLLLGLTQNEKNQEPYYTVTGIHNPDQAQSEVVTLSRECFNIPIQPHLEVISYEEKKLLLIYIPEVEPYSKPVFIKSEGSEKGAFRRIGPTDQRCTQDDLQYLYQQRDRKKYEDSVLENACFDDFDPQAIQAYRNMRKEVSKNAEELKYNNRDLLRALSVWVPHRGGMYPTVAGLVLFGKSMALRRIFPINTRVDYLLIEGTRWMPNVENPYHAIELREGLITLIPRLLHHIMKDIPQAFALESNEIYRKDNPAIPRKAIREAVCNTLIHRDYDSSQPTQIRHYDNRIEFSNAGYSLKPEEELGLPGSIARNVRIASILHDINLAETKGTGIQTMRNLMHAANLTAPLIESDRTGNKFTLTFLTHHLFDKKDIEWLAHFKTHNLTNEEARALIVIRERGTITNADYRMFNGVDTLTANAHLRRLRTLELLEQKEKGFTTYYIPTSNLLFPKKHSSS